METMESGQMSIEGTVINLESETTWAKSLTRQERRQAERKQKAEANYWDKNPNLVIKLPGQYKTIAQLKKQFRKEIREDLAKGFTDNPAVQAILDKKLPPEVEIVSLEEDNSQLKETVVEGSFQPVE